LVGAKKQATIIRMPTGKSPMSHTSVRDPKGLKGKSGRGPEFIDWGRNGRGDDPGKGAKKEGSISVEGQRKDPFTFLNQGSEKSKQERLKNSRGERDNSQK